MKNTFNDHQGFSVELTRHHPFTQMNVCFVKKTIYAEQIFNASQFSSLRVTRHHSSVCAAGGADRTFEGAVVAVDAAGVLSEGLCACYYLQTFIWVCQRNLWFVKQILV